MQNSLRTFRKKTDITIEDICNLLSMQDCSALSRLERGHRKPNLEIIFTYHFLFDVSLEKLFEKEIRITLRKLDENIEPLINNLKTLNRSRRVKSRISFLEKLKELIEKKL